MILKDIKRKRIPNAQRMESPFINLYYTDKDRVFILNKKILLLGYSNFDISEINVL